MAEEAPENTTLYVEWGDDIIFDIRPTGRGGFLQVFSQPEGAQERIFEYDFKINNLQLVQEYQPGASSSDDSWIFEGGIISTQSDDRGPYGRQIIIQNQDEDWGVEYYFVSRRALQHFVDLINAEAERQTLLIKQKGRNVAGARMTLGNLRPPNRTPGAPNPAPELFKGQSGPMSTVLEMLTGNRARQKNIGNRLKKGRLTRSNSNERLPNLRPNRGGRRRKTRRRN